MLSQIAFWEEHSLREHPTTEDTTAVASTFDELFLRWNKAGVIVHKSVGIRLKAAYKKASNEYTKEEIFKALDTYEKVIRNPKSWWTHKYKLEDFLARGVERFLSTTEADYINGKSERTTVDIT